MKTIIQLVLTMLVLHFFQCPITQTESNSNSKRGQSQEQNKSKELVTTISNNYSSFITCITSEPTLKEYHKNQNDFFTIGTRVNEYEEQYKKLSENSKTIPKNCTTVHNCLNNHPLD